MILKELSLKNFRSYKKQTFTFDPGVTLIVGRNTVGKTNILEAIYSMAMGKSFRAGRESEVIAWGGELCVVSCVLINGDRLEMRVTTGEVEGIKAPLKKYLVNGVPRRQLDFVGNLRAVLFWPEDLELITDTPSVRRRYLDSVLCQVDREYRRTLASYERGVRQRNKLLERIREGEASRGQLIFWDQLLIKAGGYITEKRQDYLNFINNFQFSNYNFQSNEEMFNFQVTYDKSVISEARLEQYKDAEVGAAVTLVGPHRDDFMVGKVKSEKLKVKNLTDGFIDISRYGSRGEQRLAVLWLKLAELSYIEKQTGARPILLLDDIFSELDEEHRKLVVDIIGKQQTILTSAEEDIIKVIPAAAQVIRL